MGLRDVELAVIDENGQAGPDTATANLRLRWQDLRLQQPPESASEGFCSFRYEAAAAKTAVSGNAGRLLLWNLSGVLP